mmetsp:Transcript_6363/g.25701  ORF Transcript_6363/g.25701 Transcript_6363/m.25701 type:complete len:111 (+) Transcript_6363:168-500(+)
MCVSVVLAQQAVAVSRKWREPDLQALARKCSAVPAVADRRRLSRRSSSSVSRSEARDVAAPRAHRVGVRALAQRSRRRGSRVSQRHVAVSRHGVGGHQPYTPQASIGGCT